MLCFLCLMIRGPPRSTLTDTLLPYTTLFRSVVMIVLGVMGWVRGRFGCAASPIVLGLILGAIAEQGFVQGWTIGAAVGDLPGMFFGRPISLAIIALTLLSLLYPLLRGRIFGRRGAAGGEGANVD